MKKGQISIFVVIAAIFVVVGVFLFFVSIDDISFWNDSLQDQISDVVDVCIRDEAERGAFLLGFQGGYISLDNEVNFNPSKYVDLGIKIPNWDSERGVIPTIISMENELNVYLSSNVYSCVETNLRALEDNLDIHLGESIFINAQINKKSISVVADLAITASEKNSGDEVTLKNFYVNLEGISLGDMYDLAIEIYNLEQKKHIFEDLTLEQIYSASDYSTKESMPSEGMTFSCVKRIWTKEQLKSNLANLNNNNFKYLQFQGTYSKAEVFDANLNEKFGTLDLRDYYLSPIVGYVQSLNSPKPSYIDYDVSVVMPSTEVVGDKGFFRNYPFREFEVVPSSGQVVKSINMELKDLGNIPIPCIQIYHHLYTLDYDLIVKLEDKGEGSLGYFFQFPLRVVIKNNNPKQRIASLIPESIRTADNEKFCAKENKKYPLRVFVSDKSNEELLNDVSISYECISLSCDIGKTEKLNYKGYEYGFNAKLEADFPFCIGGTIVAEKEGYHRTKVRIEKTDDSLLNSEDILNVDISLVPKLNFKLDKRSFLIIDIKTGKGRSVVNEDDGFVYVFVRNENYDFTSEVFWPNDGKYLDTLEFLDSGKDLAYNLSMIYVDKDYNLKGILELDNWVFDLDDIKNSRDVRINIPGSSSSIDADNYLEFYQVSKDLALNENNPYFVDFGISFK